MKKLLTIGLLSLTANMSFAQVEVLDQLFHSGPESEKAAEAMMQEVMMTAMSAAMANGGKEVNEKELAGTMFDGMAKHADALKAGMQKDCAAENDKKACACFYEQVDLDYLFTEMKKALVSASTEQEAEENLEKSLEPYQEDLAAKRAQCKL